MKCKKSCIEIIFTIQISPKEIKEFKIDESNLIKKFLSPKKREIGQKEYDLLVILNGKAYFHEINSVSKKMNHFCGLPENIEEYFRLSKKYKVLCIEKKIENTRVELFRNINEQNNMGSLEVEDKKLQDSVTRDKSICV